MDFRPERNHDMVEWVTPTKARNKALIEEGAPSIRGAARRFGVPKLTIHDCMHIKLNKQDRRHLMAQRQLRTRSKTEVDRIGSID
jgi:hypothetical protein